MNVDSVITLDNDVNVLLLEKVTYDDNNYFLSVALDENEEPTDEYAVLKEIIEGEDIFVEKEERPEILIKLNDMFTDSLKDLVDNLPEE